MLHSSNLRKLLQQTLEPINTPVSRYHLQSAVLLSRKTGSIVSFASVNNLQSNNRDTINNLKMMALFIKEKWAEDEQDPEAQSTKSCYHVTVPPSSSASNQAVWTSRIYTCGLEDLHTCVTQIPDSDLLLLFIGDSSFPHGLLVMKMKSVLSAFKDIYGYKLD